MSNIPRIHTGILINNFIVQRQVFGCEPISANPAVKLCVLCV